MTADTSQCERINCASLVAHMEGRARIQFFGDDIAKHSLPGLDPRVRILETKYQITPPPPSTEPTWESLAWRIARVQAAQGKSIYVDTTVLKTTFFDLLPKDVEGTMETLKTICMELGKSGRPHLPGQYEQKPWPKGAADEELLDVIRQRMCYIAGREHLTFSHYPVTRREVYGYLASLSIHLSDVPYVPGMPPPPRGWLAPRIKKPCCGCCDCFCHKDDDDDSTESSIVTEKPMRRFGFGWLKKLACWRRTDDAASIRTKSTGSTTIMDI